MLPDDGDEDINGHGNPNLNLYGILAGTVEYNYTKIHRCPPAESDLQYYFRVSPPQRSTT